MTISKITTESIAAGVSLTGNTSLETLTVSGIRVGKSPGSETTYISTVLGKDALSSETTGSDNVAVGRRALKNSTTSFYNIGIGTDCLFTNTTGFQNVGVGAEALYYNETGRNNTAVGTVALCRNTVGRDNTALGFEPMAFNTTGEYNVALGSEALLKSTIGNNNTSCGALSLYNSLTGNNNTAVGYRSGYNITSGANNTILGCFDGNQNGLDITTSNNYIILSDGGGNPRAIIDNLGNMGIGTSSPGAKLHVTTDIRVSATSPFFDIDATNRRWWVAAVDTGSSDANFQIGVGSAHTNNLLTMTPSGNLGLGVTPSAWNSAFKVLQTGGNGFFGSVTNNLFIGVNWYDNSSDVPVYISNGPASYYKQNSGYHYWYNAPSGTAGNTFTFTQAMTLDASGNLIVGDTSGTSGINLVRSGSDTAEIKLKQTGTNGRDWRIGSTGSGYGSAGNLIFYDATAGIERVRISSSGYVGIGINNPIQPLHVGGTGNIYVSSGGTIYSGGHLYIRAGSSGNLRFGANDSNDLATLDASGNFYVNSTNALGKLTVGVGNTNPDGQTTNAVRDIVAFSNSTAGVFGIWPLRDGGSTYDGGLVFLGQYYNGSSYVWKERMRISSSGNIGIATNTPAQKLEIRGNGGGDTVTLQLTNDGSHPARVRLHSGHGNWSVGNSITVGDALEFRDESAGLTRALINSSGHLLPGTTDSYDLGSSSFAWRNIYTNDLHLSNETKVDGNDVDGTTGNWTIQEGEDNLYIINNKTNKIYKFCLEEI